MGTGQNYHRLHVLGFCANVYGQGLSRAKGQEMGINKHLWGSGELRDMRNAPIGAVQPYMGPVHLTKQISDADLAEFHRRFEEEYLLFKEQLPQLLNDYPGEFVALRNGKVIAHDQDHEKLAKRASEEFPDEFIFIEKVAQPSATTLHMDSMGF